MKKLFTICLFVMAVGFMNAQTTIFSENFDSYTAGQFVNTQQPEFFPWTGATAEKAYVSDVQSHSPSNSMKIVNDNDMVFDFGGKTSGSYEVNFWIYIVDTKGGYFNVEHAFGSSWAFSFYFKPGGTCDIAEGGQTHTFNYTLNTWMHIELDIDVTGDLATATVDGTQIAQWAFSNEEEAAGGTTTLDVINFYGLHTASTGVSASEYYVDDFEFIEVSSGLMPATIDIDTTPIVVYGQPGHSISFSNTGEEAMNFSAYPVFMNPSVDGALANGIMAYDQGSASAIGWASEFEVYAATRFLPDMAVTHLGQNIVSATIFINDAPVGNTIEVYVWEKGEYALPGTGNILAQKTFTVTAQSDNTIVFDTPVTITGDEIWIGYKFTTPANLYTLGTDDQALVPNTCYIKAGPVWSVFDGVGGNMMGNFSIRANVEGLGWPAWMTVAPASGNVAPSGTQNLGLNFITTGLPDGTYEADVVVGCNDPASEWNEVHVTLDIITGIENNTIGVMTYPNPATDFIQVVSDNMLQNVTIYTMDGKMVLSMNPETTTTSIDVTGLAAGSYIMDVKAGNQSFKKNIVVK